MTISELYRRVGSFWNVFKSSFTRKSGIRYLEMGFLKIMKQGKWQDLPVVCTHDGATNVGQYKVFDKVGSMYTYRTKERDEKRGFKTKICKKIPLKRRFFENNQSSLITGIALLKGILPAAL